MEGNEERGDVADGFMRTNTGIETIDAGLLVLSIRQGRSRNQLTHAHADGAPSIVFVQGRILGI